jgi:proteasome lid subunit RPN8/RPN11
VIEFERSVVEFRRRVVEFEWRVREFELRWGGLRAERARTGADVTRADFKIPRTLAEEMCAHARAVAPEECCGLLGARNGGNAESAYPLRNVARAPLVAYEAAPEELFDAQRLMRARGESLVGVYHSHPRSADPVPSETDVRLAFYPSAVYFIVGFDVGGRCVPRAFRISEREGRWERAAFEFVD